MLGRVKDKSILAIEEKISQLQTILNRLAENHELQEVVSSVIFSITRNQEEYNTTEASRISQGGISSELEQLKYQLQNITAHMVDVFQFTKTIITTLDTTTQALLKTSLITLEEIDPNAYEYIINITDNTKTNPYSILLANADIIPDSNLIGLSQEEDII